MLKLLTLILTAVDVQASAGGAHGGSISDLILPAWNFIPLSILLIALLRKPIRDGFNKNAADVESLYNVAEEKDKEAQIKLDMYEKKMSSLKVETDRVMKEAQARTEEFDKNSQIETEQIVQKMGVDAETKVTYEKEQAVRVVNASLVDEVIAKAKSKIKENKDFNTKATNKLVAEI
jgi:F-type H+-transporting ATPase subunit b